MTHQLDKAVALLKSLAADHDRGDGTDHEWRTCRACLASEELGYAKVGDVSSPAQRLLRLLITELDGVAALRQRPCPCCGACPEDYPGACPEDYPEAKKDWRGP
jgi:hypothetical protein